MEYVFVTEESPSVKIARGELVPLLNWAYDTYKEYLKPGTVILIEGRSVYTCDEPVEVGLDISCSVIQLSKGRELIGELPSDLDILEVPHGIRILFENRPRNKYFIGLGSVVSDTQELMKVTIEGTSRLKELLHIDF